MDRWESLCGGTTTLACHEEHAQSTRVHEGPRGLLVFYAYQCANRTWRRSKSGKDKNLRDELLKGVRLSFQATARTPASRVVLKKVF
jgi:hypothetical protein